MGRQDGVLLGGWDGLLLGGWDGLPPREWEESLPPDRGGVPRTK